MLPLDHERDHEAMALPQEGDHWHEMFAYHIYVVKVNVNHVWTVEGSGDFAKTCEVHQMSRDQFNARMRYGGCGNLSFRPTDDVTEIKNKSWLNLGERACKVSGWLDRCIELQRPWIEHCKV
jgi:hypothetical protein